MLLDAPCSSTGTIRRHPDIPWLKRESRHRDAGRPAAPAALTRAVELVRPGGVLVYCTCSLEPEEGTEIVAELLAGDSRLRRRPIAPAEVGGLAELIDSAGDLRTLPCHLPDPIAQMGGDRRLLRGPAGAPVTAPSVGRRHALRYGPSAG